MMKRTLGLGSFHFHDKYISDKTPVTPTSGKDCPWVGQHLSSSCSHHTFLNVLTSTVLKYQDQERSRGEAINNALFPNTNLFSGCHPKAWKAKQRWALCQSVKPVVDKMAGTWTSWSLPLRASSLWDLWSPTPGSHPYLHTFQTTHLCCYDSFSG